MHPHSTICMIRADNIPAAVSAFHPSRLIPEFSDDCFNKPFQGGQCTVYKVHFHDGKTWAVRVPNRLDSQAAGCILAQENELLRCLNDVGFRWAPHFIGEALSCDNIVGFPFVVYEWIAGSPLEWSTSYPPTRKLRDKLIEQLAEVLLSLVSKTGKGQYHHRSLSSTD